MWGKWYTYTEEHRRARESIINPVLREAFDAGWYYPWSVEDWPEEDRKHELVQKAICEGWAEWITTQADLEAVKQGYFYDQSRDRKGNPVYWLDGGWVRWSEDFPRGQQLEKIPIELAEHPADPVITHFGAGDVRSRFVECFLFNSKSSLASKPDTPYRLLHWQRWCLQTVFGWVRNEIWHGESQLVRRYQKALIELAKKNGKSDFVSTVSLIMVKGDGEEKAAVYGAACDKDQASIVFNEARDYVNNSPRLSRILYVRDSRQEQSISDLATVSKYQVVSADAYSKDGYDASGVIFDELHQQRKPDLYEIFERSGQSRMQPIEWVITTYGSTLKCIWGEVHLKGRKQTQGHKIDITNFVMCASAEPIPVVLSQDAQKGSQVLHVERLEQPIQAGEVLKFEVADMHRTKVQQIPVVVKYPVLRFQRHIEIEPLRADMPIGSDAKANENPLRPDRIDHAIRRANPSVDITQKHERVKAKIVGAEGPRQEAKALRFNLNVVAGDGELWISGAAWIACGKSFRKSSLRKARCHGGLDLSVSNDLSAFFLSFPNWARSKKFRDVPDPMVRLLGMVWVPGFEIEKREEQEQVQYRALAEQPYFGSSPAVRICNGEGIDYRQVGEDIIEFAAHFDVEAIAFDSYRSREVVNNYLTPAGLTCIQHRQGPLSMAPATMLFDNLLKKRRVRHGNHPLLDQAIEGCVLSKPDKAGNCHPVKDKSISRIDPLIAALMAVNWTFNPPENSGGRTSAWSSREKGSFLAHEE